MIPLIILLSIASIFFVFLIWQVWSRYAPKREAALASQLTPIDLDAFENLLDREEEQFLRENLSSREFRSVQRSRIRVARMYVGALSRNAGVLVAMGQSARLHSNPEVAASGQKIFQQAIRLKVWCMVSELRLDAALAFPAILSPAGGISQQYLIVKSIAGNLPSQVAA